MVDEVTEFDTTKKYPCSECGEQEAKATLVDGQRSRDADVETTNFECSACGVIVQRHDEVLREVTLTVLECGEHGHDWEGCGKLYEDPKDGSLRKPVKCTACGEPSVKIWSEV